MASKVEIETASNQQSNTDPQSKQETLKEKSKDSFD